MYRGSDSWENEARAFRSKLMRLRVLQHAFSSATLFLFCAGAVILCLRFFTNLPPLWYRIGLCALPLVLAYAWWSEQREAPSLDQLRAFLDKRNRAGGLIMAAAEQDLGPWAASLPPTQSIDLRWRKGSASAGVLGAAMAFVALALMIPVSWGRVDRNPPLDIEPAVQELNRKIDVLEETETLDEFRAEEIKEQLEKARKEAEGHDPVKTWETLDHLRDSLSAEAMERAENALADLAEMAQAEELAGALQQLSHDGLFSESLSDGMEELAALIEQAGLEKQLAEMPLSEQLMEQLSEQKLTPEQLKQLAEMLKSMKEGELANLQQLKEARLIDPSTMSQCEKSGSCNSTNLASFLAQCEGEGDSLSVALAKCSGGEGPGKGGISRGPGHADLTWSNDTQDDNIGFVEQALPPGSLQNLKDSTVLGLSRAEPTLAPEASGDVGSAVSASEAGLGTAHTQTILPKHKAVLQAYFERDGEE